MNTTAATPLAGRESERRFPGWMLVGLVALPGLAGACMMFPVPEAVRIAVQAGIILVAPALGAGVCRGLQRWEQRAAEQITAVRAEAQQSRAEWEREVADLRSQLTVLEREREALQRERELLREQLDREQRAGAELRAEFERRKRAESGLLLERQQLCRSKDTLELHVQARTRELQQLKTSFEQILNAAGEGICSLDADERITFANPTAAHLLGWDLAALTGRSAQEVFRPAPGRVNGHSYREEGRMELVFQRPDGSEFTAEFCRAPLPGGGERPGAVVVFRDVTLRKRNQEELARKAAELARSNAELEQFAFVASHDLQEPLRKIQAFGDRLRESCRELSLGEGRDYLDRMQRAAARMQQLINDLLTFSRVLRSTRPFGPVDLHQLAHEVMGDLEARIEQTAARIIIGPLPTIEGDATQLRQLLQNLVSNALKFQPPGATPEVEIQARWLPPESPVAAVAPDLAEARGIIPAHRPETVERCELTVRDNGIGFDEKYLDRIFAVFQRLHGRTEYEGTGVGLAVCRRIVERHGGHITARSKPGQGATFVVTLPVRQTVSRLSS